MQHREAATKVRRLAFRHLWAKSPFYPRQIERNHLDITHHWDIKVCLELMEINGNISIPGSKTQHSWEIFDNLSEYNYMSFSRNYIRPKRYWNVDLWPRDSFSAMEIAQEIANVVEDGVKWPRWRSRDQPMLRAPSRVLSGPNPDCWSGWEQIMSSDLAWSTLETKNMHHLSNCAHSNWKGLSGKRRTRIFLAFDVLKRVFPKLLLSVSRKMHLKFMEANCRAHLWKSINLCTSCFLRGSQNEHVVQISQKSNCKNSHESPIVAKTDNIMKSVDCQLIKEVLFTIDRFVDGWNICRSVIKSEQNVLGFIVSEHNVSGVEPSNFTWTLGSHFMARLHVAMIWP